MDRLDDVLHTTRPLLERVDRSLTVAGAPGDHPVWTEVRRVRLLPGDAARAVAALRPGEFDEAGPAIRAEARMCEAAATDLPAAGAWTGEAADAYDEVRQRMAARLGGTAEGLGGRLAGTAGLAEAVRDWMVQTRHALARTLAEVASSQEAFLVAAGGGGLPSEADIRAAADVAAVVLRTVGDRYDDASDLIHGSAALTEVVPM
jgi:hypothetical protein